MPRSLSVICIAGALCALTTACSPHNPQAPQPDNNPQPQSGASVVMDATLTPLLKDRDRARAVQKIVDDQAAKASSTIDAESH